MRLSNLLLMRGEKILKYSKSYGNLPERYILRTSTRLREKWGGENNELPVLDTVPLKMHTMDRPWTEYYWRANKNDEIDDLDNPCVVEPIREEDWMWFKGDRVEITSGKDKGKQGYINYIVQERNWVTVEGLNLKYTTYGKTKKYPGLLFPEEQPYLVTEDLKLVDPIDEKPCEVEWRYTDDGERVRVSLKTGSEIPIPSEQFQTIDYKTKKGYKENETKDTSPKIVETNAYRPSLKTFEMEIMDKMKISEDRIPKRSYFY